MNKRGSAPGVILAGLFFMILLVNCYIIMMHYAHTRNIRYVISSDIENSYKQPLEAYQSNFEQFCSVRDFINPNYKPEEVYIIIPESSGFNIDRIVENSKTHISNTNSDISEAFSIFDKEISNYNQKTKIKKYLNSNPKAVLVFYKYKDKSMLIESSFLVYER